MTLLIACQANDDKTIIEKKETEIISEVIKTKNGHSKINDTSEGVQMPHGTLQNLQSQDISTQSLLDKYLVINLWATWCSPCMKDTPAFQKIAKDYPQAKFISVSIDKKKEDWSTFLQTENWSGNHYWMGMDDNNPFYSFAYTNINSDNINGVHVTLPKYIIISPKGNILKGNFAGPGTPVFEEVLDKHLR